MEGIKIEFKGIMFVVDPKGVITICRVSHTTIFRDSKRTSISKTAKIIPVKGTTENK